MSYILNYYYVIWQLYLNETGKRTRKQLGTGKDKLEEHTPKIHKYTKNTQKLCGGNDYQ